MTTADTISVEDLMVALKVISQLKTHERVSTKGDVIRIEQQDWGQSLRRWFTGESRVHNIGKIEGILNSAFAQVKLRLQKPHPTTDDNDFFARLRAELDKTEIGLQNLKCTYQNCSVTKARLDCVLERISANTRLMDASRDSAAAAASASKAHAD